MYVLRHLMITSKHPRPGPEADMPEDAPTKSQKAAGLTCHDALCWQEAIAIHNSNQKKGASSTKYIRLHTTGILGDQITSTEYAHELMTAALNSYHTSKKKRGLHATMMVQICQNIRQYSRAIDAFIQSDPGIAGLIWGSVRVLLQIGEEQERSSRLASEGIIEIVRHAGRWEQVSAISDLLHSTRIRAALITLYVKVLDFLMSSTKWLKQSTLKRIGISILDSKGDKFQEKMDEMKRAAEHVDKELQTLSTYKGITTLHALSSDIHGLMEKMDGLFCEAKNLSDCLSRLGHELLIATGQNNKSVQMALSDLQLLPLAISQTVMSEIQDTLNLGNIKRWLLLNATEPSPPVPHVDGTCSWFIQNPAFIEWDQSDKSTTLWVKGHQGSGKSVMAGYLQDYLAGRGNDMVLSYRFQRSASNTQSTPTSLAASLIYQGVAKVPATLLDAGAGPIQDLQTLMTRYPLGPQHCPFKTLWAVASSLLDKISAFSHPILILDAMDECSLEGPSLPGTLPFLKMLFETMGTNNTKIVVFARPEAQFTAVLEQQSIPSIFLSHHLLFPDIVRFAEFEYARLGLPSSESTKVMELVDSSAHGSFRWVELFLDHLGQSVRADDLQARMQTSLPPSVEDLYTQSMLSAMEMLTPAELDCRRSLLSMVFQAQRPLRTTEVIDALSLLREKADVAISRLCKPLASTYGGIFHLSHPTVREFFEKLIDQNADIEFGIQLRDSDAMLAERCLECLMNERYADLDRIAVYLMANHDENLAIDSSAEPPDGGFYDYAFRFWCHHLVRVTRPSIRLLQLASSFMVSLQFAYWSEKSRRDSGQLVRANVARNSLASWSKKLSSQDQELIELEEFFYRPYSLLGAAFAAKTASDTSSKLLSCLARMTIGDFYFMRVQIEKLTETRQAVYKELRSLVGPQHRLTLRAYSDLAFVRILDGKMRASYEMHMEALNMQREAYGEESLRFLETLVFTGQSEYYMADFVAAVVTWTRASAESLRILGSDSWVYLSAQWWLVQGLAYLGQLEPALPLAESAVKKRRDLFGPTDSFADMVQITVGEIHLLLRQQDEAIVKLTEVIGRWREARSLSESLCRLDAELALAAAYYAVGGPRDDEALAIVSELEPVIASSRRFDFPRQCQLIHLKSLLLLRRNDRRAHLDEAINLLQSSLSQAELDQENRVLLWIRLDLATLLRARNAPGDAEQASANFDNLVRDVSGEVLGSGFPDEPDPPRFWDVAERALRLVRDRKHLEAKKELEREGLEWKRESDFWLWWSGNFCKDLLRFDGNDLDWPTSPAATPTATCSGMSLSTEWPFRKVEGWVKNTLSDLRKRTGGRWAGESVGTELD